MKNRGVLEDGDDVDFDQLNENSGKRGVPLVNIKIGNADVEKRNISASTAYETYSTVDKSLGASRDKRRLEITETPKEKFARIQKEFEELKEGLEAVKSDEDPQVQLLFKEIEKVQNELSGIVAQTNFKRILDSETVETLNADEHILALRNNLDHHKTELLLNQLRGLQSQGGAAQDLAYQIHLNLAADNVRRELRLSDVHRRIENIERIIGNSNAKEISDNVKKLKNMTKFLIESDLDSLLGKISHATQQLDRIGNKKSDANIDDDKLIKVDSLYDNYLKVEHTAEQLPQIISRMESLKTVHEESAKIANKITKLTENQNAVLSNLETNQELLKKIEESFGKNLESINANFASLQERINKLKK